MLDQDTRTAIWTLHQKGHSHRRMAQALGVSRNSVKAVLASGNRRTAQIQRSSKLQSSLEDVRALFAKCQGNLVRVREELLKQHQIKVSYSTLTWFCRKYGIGEQAKEPVRRIVTGPGEEMQHDTSPYTLSLGGKKVKRICASLVLGYSRMLFVRFYPKFDRFTCKVFLTEALKSFGGSGRRCVIDNASIIIACGAGRNAQISPEMEAFADRFGFHFYPHALGAANRSGKVERPFWYVERNLLAGRYFKDDADLNRQAAQWADEVANRRILRELKARPLELFAAEKPHLVALPLHVPEVYRTHQRLVDVYSYIHLHGFRYPIPSRYIDKTLWVRETAQQIIVLDGHQEIVRHNKLFEGSPTPPAPPPQGTPRWSKQTNLAEEDRLKALGDPLPTYLAELKNHKPYRYLWSLRKLYRLLCQYKQEDFIAAVTKAHHHRLFDVNRLETLLLQNIAQKDYFLPLGFEASSDQSWQEFQQGAATPEPDLSDYLPQQPPEDDHAS